LVTYVQGWRNFEWLKLVLILQKKDDIYLEKRAHIFSFHPSHLFEGIGLGAWALFAGIHRGAFGNKTIISSVFFSISF